MPVNMQLGMANGEIFRPRVKIVVLVTIIERATFVQEFVVMDVADHPNGDPPQIILGRIFITTAG